MHWQIWKHKINISQQNFGHSFDWSFFQKILKVSTSKFLTSITYTAFEQVQPQGNSDAINSKEFSNVKNLYLKLHTFAAIRMLDAYGCKWSWHSWTKSLRDIDADCANNGSWRPFNNSGRTRPITSGCSLNHSEKAPATWNQPSIILTF